MDAPLPPVVPCPLRRSARETPDRPALTTPERVWSHAALDRQVGRAVRRLRQIGVEEGTRVGIWMPNDPAFITVLIALFRLGAVACPLSTRFPAAAARERLDRILGRMLITGAGADEPAFESLTVLAAEELVAETVDTDPDAPVWHLDRPATIVFTSGSTGTGKAALHALGNHVYSALGSNLNIALGPGDGWLLALPLYHVGGLAIVVRCLMAGARVALPAPGAPVGAALRASRASHVSLVSTQLRRLLEEDPQAGRALSALLLGGSAMPAGLVREAHRGGWPVHVSYGSTETASQLTSTPPGASLETLLETSGRLLPHRELRLARDGEILVRGRTRFLGYVDGPTLIRPFDTDGWFATGDLGALDAGGYLRVVGRKDDMFISGGENIHPETIERALAGLPRVEAVAVVPVPDPEFGFRPVAFVRSPAPDPDAWRAALEALLPRFMVPKIFLPWPDEAERGLKIDRAWLRARAESLT